jgi:hypothetical protein
MSTHFEAVPGIPGAKYNYTGSGAVWLVELTQYQHAKIALIDGAGLLVRSNNFKVVPNDEANFKGAMGYGQRRIIEFYTLDYGTTMLEVKNSGATSEVFSNDNQNPGEVVATLQVRVRQSPAKPTTVKLDRPQTALNAPNVTHRYMMTHSYLIDWSTSAEDMLAKVSPDSKHLAICAHGEPAAVSIGRGLSMRNVDAFRALQASQVQVIWFGNCSVAGNPTGDAFCSTVARNAASYVVAPAMTLVGHLTGIDRIEWFGFSLPHFFDYLGRLIEVGDFVKLHKDLGFTIEPH